MSKYEELQKNFKDLNEHYRDVMMNQIKATNDSETILYTNTLATCVGLAIVAKDSNNNVYRILSHNYAFSEDYQLKQLDDIKKYLKAIPSLVDLKVIYCSMDSFKDFDNLDDIESDIVEKLNNTFAFYQNDHPDFNIDFYQSWYVVIYPDGNIEYADQELINDYMADNQGIKPF